VSDERRVDYLILDLVERIDRAQTVAEAARTLLDGLKPMGALSVMATDVLIAPKPMGAHTPPVVAGIAPKGWQESAAGAFVDAHNPNPDMARRVRRPFMWKTAPLPTKALYSAYWEAIGEFGGKEGLAVPLVETGITGGVSMAFATEDWSPRERRAMEFACYTFLDKVRSLSPTPPEPPRLSVRERDVMAYIAEGKTDWETSVILGVSQNTVHHHVENARRKLGAATRAQGVARFILAGLR